MDVAVIGGTGAEGFGIALRLAAVGHHVVIGSREAERGGEAGARAVEELGGHATVDGTDNAGAANAADVVFVTVPFAAQADICRSIKEAVRPGSIVLDATSPLATAVGGRPWQLVRPWDGSAAEQARSILGHGPRVVAGFHTIAASALQDLGRPIDSDVLLVRGRRRREARGGWTLRGDPRPAVGGLRRPVDGAHHRDHHGAVDQRESPLQGPRLRLPHLREGDLGQAVTERGRLVPIDDTALWVAERGRGLPDPRAARWPGSGPSRVRRLPRSARRRVHAPVRGRSRVRALRAVPGVHLDARASCARRHHARAGAPPGALRGARSLLRSLRGPPERRGLPGHGLAGDRVQRDPFVPVPGARGRTEPVAVRAFLAPRAGDRILGHASRTCGRRRSSRR